MNAETPISAPVIPGERDPRPTVALPRQGLPGIAIAGICLVLALLLFLVLNGRREAREATALGEGRSPGVAFTAPPPLTLPAETAPQPVEPPPVRIYTDTAPPLRLRASPPVATYVPPQVQIAPVRPWDPEPTYGAPEPFTAAPAEPAVSLDDPAMVIDSGGIARPAPGGEPAAPPPVASGSARPPAPTTIDRNTSRVSKISNPATVMPVGTLIQAVLETPIDTAKPGMARAIVSRDAHGFNGRQVLVPRGSRLAGEYLSDTRSGQKRVLINWTQLIRPDGSVIRLDSPSADELGGAGVPGEVSGFSLGRFAAGVLRTALAAGTSWASFSGRGSQVIVGLPGTQLTNIVPPSRGRQPRIKVKQGTAFNVFVARNLDFSGAAPTQ